MRLDLGNNIRPLRRFGRNLTGFLSSLYTPPNTEVDFERPELEPALIQYTKIRDCLLGEDHIKSKGEVYLPRPSYDEDDPENRQDMLRYHNYLLRATFLNATGFTQRTTVGKLFTKPPTVILPEALESLRDDVNGEGLAFEQLIERVAGEIFAFGRGGLYTDFNAMPEGQVSIADTEGMSPTLHFVEAENVINWRIDKNTKKLVLVVVREPYEEHEQFAVRVNYEYRAFILDEQGLRVEVWRPRSQEGAFAGSGQRFEIYKQFRPTLPGGEPWDEIPFVCIGSTNNDWTIDPPPLYSLATHDLSLYRNSADLEESAHLVGQATPVATGIRPDWAKKFGLTKMRWGSGRFIPIESPQAKVELVQARAQTLLDKLIEEKNKTIRQMGATLFSVETLTDDQTATGAVFQALKLHAPLITTSRNVIAGVRKAVGYAARYLGIDPDTDEIELRLNSEILDNPLGVTGLRIMMELWRAGIITFEEAREQVEIQGLSLHNTEEAAKLLENPTVAPASYSRGTIVPGLESQAEEPAPEAQGNF